MRWHDAPHWHPRRVAGPAAVAALLLLLSFHQVVSGAMRHAHQHQTVTAERQDAFAGCRGLADAAAQALCVSRLNVALLDDAEPALKDH